MRGSESCPGVGGVLAAADGALVKTSRRRPHSSSPRHVGHAELEPADPVVASLPGRQHPVLRGRWGGDHPRASSSLTSPSNSTMWRPMRRSQRTWPGVVRSSNWVSIGKPSSARPGGCGSGSRPGSAPPSEKCRAAGVARTAATSTSEPGLIRSSGHVTAALTRRIDGHDACLEAVVAGDVQRRASEIEDRKPVHLPFLLELVARLVVLDAGRAPGSAGPRRSW